MSTIEERRRLDRTMIEAAFTRLFAKDIDGYVQHFTEDCTASVPWQLPAFPGTVSGRAALSQSLEPVLAAFDTYDNHIIRIEPLLDPAQWLAEVKCNAVVRHNRRPYRQHYLHLLTLRDGKITELTTYENMLQVAFAFELDVPRFA